MCCKKSFFSSILVHEENKKIQLHLFADTWLVWQSERSMFSIISISFIKDHPFIKKTPNTLKLPIVYHAVYVFILIVYLITQNFRQTIQIN